MAHLSTHQQEKIIKWFSRGGRVAAVAGPRRSGLTWYVDTLVGRVVAEYGTRLVTVDIHEQSDELEVTKSVARQLRVHSSNSHDFMSLIQNATNCLWYVKNLHRGRPEVRKWILGSCLRVNQQTRDSHNFVLEGACDFDDAISDIEDRFEPLIGYVDSQTPWRTVVEVEHIISTLSSSIYPRSFVVWLADVTNGDAGFCNEFLLRFHNTNPTEMLLNNVYDAIVRNGRTAREVRKAAEGFPSPVIESLLNGDVIPGLSPPQGSKESTRLVLEGLAQYDELVGGYRIRSPIVRDSLLAEGKWRLPSAKERGIAGGNHLLWQISVAELLLRSLMHVRAETMQKIGEMSVPSPWKGKATEVKRRLFTLLKNEGFPEDQCKKVLQASTAELGEVLPDSFNAAVRAKSILESNGDWDGNNLLDGLTFSDIANLAASLGVVTNEERDRLRLVNDRRNDAAHFRPVGYDDACNLERIVREILPAINTRATSAAKD